MKRHIQVTRRGRNKYICKFELCNFEVLEKVYLVRHNQRRTFRETRFATSSKPEDHTTQTLSREKSEHVGEKPQTVERENEKSQMVLCSSPGCVFLQRMLVNRNKEIIYALSTAILSGQKRPS